MLSFFTVGLLVQADRSEDGLAHDVRITVGAGPTVLEVALALVGDASRNSHGSSTIGNS